MRRDVELWIDRINGRGFWMRSYLSILSDFVLCFESQAWFGKRNDDGKDD